MRPDAFLRRFPSGTLGAQDIVDVRINLEALVLTSRHDYVPRKSRMECLDGVQRMREDGNNAWVRDALDLTTHTLFRTERSVSRSNSRNRASIKRRRDTDHWSQLCELLSERYGSSVDELKLLLITGSFAEMESLASQETDDLIGPYRAIRDVEEWLRHNAANRRRGLDIQSLKRLEAQYNNIAGTPMHDLVQLGLSRVINLESADDIRGEYRRIFVERRSVATSAVAGTPLFALSYKHESQSLWMSEENFSKICDALRGCGFREIQLWIDAVLKKTIDRWASRGLLPYTVLPIVIHNNDYYENGKERIWLKLERVAASGRCGVVYTQRTTDCDYDCPSAYDYVTGDSRNLVAACILSEDYDPQSVTYASDVSDLREWAIEHLTVATFRSFLGISKVGRGGVSDAVEQECRYSALLKYDEIMPHGRSQHPVNNRWFFPCSNNQNSRMRAKNERIMVHMCEFNGTLYRVRSGFGLGITVCKVHVKEMTGSKGYIEGFSKVSPEERQGVLMALTSELILCERNLEDCSWSAIVRSQTGVHVLWALAVYVFWKVVRFFSGYKRHCQGLQVENDGIRIAPWSCWPEVFPVVAQPQ